MKCNFCPLNKKCINKSCECISSKTNHSRYCELVNPYSTSYNSKYIGFILKDCGIEYKPLIYIFDDCLNIEKHINDQFQVTNDIVDSDIIIFSEYSSIENIIKEQNSKRFIFYHKKNIIDYHFCQGIITENIESLDKEIHDKVLDIKDISNINTYIKHIIDSNKNQFHRIPSFIEKLKNITKAAKIYIENIPRLVKSSNFKDNRLEICNKCIYLTEKRECIHCGCLVDLKTQVPSESCPYGFWKSLISNTNNGCNQCGKPKHNKKTLVVSRYQKDLDWLKYINQSEINIVIYNKGKKNLNTNYNIINKDNIGREAETISTYIYNNYENLSEFTFFSQDDPFEHSPFFLKLLEYSYNKETSLTKHYSEKLPPKYIKDQDSIEFINKLEIRYGNALINEHGDGTINNPWYNKDSWNYLFNCEIPDPLWFGYGAMWVVPRQNLLARPRNFWGNLSKEIIDGELSAPGKSYTNPPLNPWSMEVMWKYVFSDPKIYPHHTRFDNVN